MGVLGDLTRKLDRAERDKRMLESAVDGAAELGRNLHQKGASGLLDRGSIRAMGQLDRGLDMLKRSGLADGLGKHLKK